MARRSFSCASLFSCSIIPKTKKLLTRQSFGDIVGLYRYTLNKQKAIDTSYEDHS